MSIITVSPNAVELDGFDLMAVAELASLRREMAAMEDRQKAVRAALMEKLDTAGATEGFAGGVKVVSIVESTRPVISANKVRDLFPAVWDELGTTTSFRSIRLDAPSVTA